MSRLPAEFWNPISIKPLTGLAELRKVVVEHNESRMPKWKFRFAADLVCQIQPKVSEKYTELFECHAFEYLGASDKVFQSRTFARANGRWGDCKFRLYRPECGWSLKATCAGAFRTVDPDPTNPFSRSRVIFSTPDTITLRDRLVQFFAGDFFENITPKKMLSHHCMICGKALTDPASMARMIGPECYGSGSILVPWLYEKLSQ